MLPPPPRSTLFPYTTLFRSVLHPADAVPAPVQTVSRIRTASSSECNKCNRSEEHTSELQSRENLVCRLLLEKKKNKQIRSPCYVHPPNHIGHLHRSQILSQI